MYKAALKKRLDTLIQDGAVLYFRKRGKSLSGEGRPTLASTDLLRETAEYYYRNICGMNAHEVAAMMGTDRLHTVAIYYIDWNNELQLMQMKAKIDQWHQQLVGVLGLSGKTLHGRPGVLGLVRGKGGGVITIRAPRGADGYLRPA